MPQFNSHPLSISTERDDYRHAKRSVYTSGIKSLVITLAYEVYKVEQQRSQYRQDSGPARMWRICGILFLQLTATAMAQRYRVPVPELRAFKPRGLRVSIPDEPGIQLFAFHGNVNRPQSNLEAGQMSQDILRPRGGRWVFEDPDVQLRLGDVIYYWVYVQLDGRGYRRTNQQWVVSAFDEDKRDFPSPAKRPTSVYYTVPDATLEALHPKGLRVSIPDSPGVELFAFHGKVNEEMQSLEAGTMSQDVLRPKNGRWVFEDHRVRLKKGDIVYYWLYVKVDGLGYRKDDQIWIVPAAVGHSPEDSDSGSTDLGNKETNSVLGSASGTQPTTTERGTQGAPGLFPQLDFNLPEGLWLLQENGCVPASLHQSVILAWNLS
ncbi:gram-negative bacteria-binding protein 1-like isoform X2 [Periplaneta americana]|uniref:gram-negative bacteria-binding protein 1-like isoform X2 n=1 Tax=Periplaneta americana TaxID=6978 RepID=UPI0037E907C5